MQADHTPSLPVAGCSPVGKASDGRTPKPRADVFSAPTCPPSLCAHSRNRWSRGKSPVYGASAGTGSPAGWQGARARLPVAMEMTMARGIKTAATQKNGLR